MTAFRFMIDAGAVFLAAGIFLTLYNLLLTSIEVIIRIWRKTFVSWAGRRLRDMGVIQEKPFRAQVELDWKRLVLLIAIPVIALAVHDCAPDWPGNSDLGGFAKTSDRACPNQ